MPDMNAHIDRYHAGPDQVDAAAAGLSQDHPPVRPGPGDRTLSDKSVTQEFIGRLRAFIRRRVDSDADADDITQNVLLKFVHAGESIEARRGPAWMFAVARRQIIDRYRQAKLATTEIDPDTTASAEPQDEATLAELAHCVHPLIQLLDLEDRDILQRVDLQGEPQSVIADARGVPRSTVKARVQRARKRFHKELLACCSIELDARGTPSGCEPRRGGGGGGDCMTPPTQCVGHDAKEVEGED